MLRGRQDLLHPCLESSLKIVGTNMTSHSHILMLVNFPIVSWYGIGTHQLSIILILKVQHFLAFSRECMPSHVTLSALRCSLNQCYFGNVWALKLSRLPAGMQQVFLLLVRQHHRGTLLHFSAKIGEHRSVVVTLEASCIHNYAFSASDLVGIAGER